MGTDLRTLILDALRRIDPEIDPQVDARWDYALIRPLEALWADRMPPTEDFVRDALVAQGLDGGEHSAVSDMFGRPLALALEPLFRQIALQRKFSGIGDDPDALPREVVADKLSNFLVRPMDDGARTQLRLRLFLADADEIILDTDSAVRSSSGLLYYPMQRYVLGTAALQSRQVGARFVADIEVEAAEAGAAYNVGADEITEIEGVAATRVVVLSILSEGSDPQTAASYIADMTELVREMSLVTSGGIRRRLLEDLAVSRGVRIVGSGDPLMTRDRLQVELGTAPAWSPVDLLEGVYAIRARNCPYTISVTGPFTADVLGQDAEVLTQFSRAVHATARAREVLSLTDGVAVLKDIATPLVYEGANSNEAAASLLAQTATVGSSFPDLPLNITDTVVLEGAATPTSNVVPGDLLFCGYSAGRPLRRFTVHSRLGATKVRVYPTVLVATRTAEAVLRFAGTPLPRDASNPNAGAWNFEIELPYDNYLRCAVGDQVTLTYKDAAISYAVEIDELFVEDSRYVIRVSSPSAPWGGAPYGIQYGGGPTVSLYDTGAPPLVNGAMVVGGLSVALGNPGDPDAPVPCEDSGAYVGKTLVALAWGIGGALKAYASRRITSYEYAAGVGTAVLDKSLEDSADAAAWEGAWDQFAVVEDIDWAFAAYRMGVADPNAGVSGHPTAANVPEALGWTTIARPARPVAELLPLTHFSAGYGAEAQIGPKAVTIAEKRAPTLPELRVSAGRREAPYNTRSGVLPSDGARVGGCFDIYYADSAPATATAAFAFSSGVAPCESTPALVLAAASVFDGYEAPLIDSDAAVNGSGDGFIGAFADARVGDVLELADGSSHVIVLRHSGGVRTQSASGDPTAAEELTADATAKIVRESLISIRRPRGLSLISAYSGAKSVSGLTLPVGSPVPAAASPTRARFIGESNSFEAAVTSVSADQLRVSLDRALSATVLTGVATEVVELFSELGGFPGPIEDVAEIILTDAEGSTRAIPRAHPLAVVVQRIDSGEAAVEVEITDSDVWAPIWGGLPGLDDAYVFPLSLRALGAAPSLRQGDLFDVGDFRATIVAATNGLTDVNLYVPSAVAPTQTFTVGSTALTGRQHAITARVYFEQNADIEFGADAEFVVGGRTFRLAEEQKRVHRTAPIRLESDREGFSFVGGPLFQRLGIDLSAHPDTVVQLRSRTVQTRALTLDAHTFAGTTASVTLGGVTASHTLRGPNPYTPQSLKTELEAAFPGLKVLAEAVGATYVYHLYSMAALSFGDSSWNRIMQVVGESTALPAGVDTPSETLTDFSSDGSVALLDGALHANLLIADTYLADVVSARSAWSSAPDGTEFGLPYLDLRLRAEELHASDLRDLGVALGASVTATNWVGRGYSIDSGDTEYSGSDRERPRLRVSAAYRLSSGAWASCIGGSISVRFLSSATAGDIQVMLRSADRDLASDGLVRGALPVHLVFDGNPTDLPDSEFLSVVSSEILDRYSEAEVISALQRAGASVATPLRVLRYGPDQGRVWSGSSLADQWHLQRWQRPIVSIG